MELDLIEQLPVESFTGIFAVYIISNNLKIMISHHPSGKKYYILLNNFPVEINEQNVIKTIYSLLNTEMLNIERNYKKDLEAVKKSLSLFSK